MFLQMLDLHNSNTVMTVQIIKSDITYQAALCSSLQSAKAEPLRQKRSNIILLHHHKVLSVFVSSSLVQSLGSIDLLMDGGDCVFLPS